MPTGLALGRVLALFPYKDVEIPVYRKIPVAPGAVTRGPYREDTRTGSAWLRPSACRLRRCASGLEIGNRCFQRLSAGGGAHGMPFVGGVDPLRRHSPDIDFHGHVEPFDAVAPSVADDVAAGLVGKNGDLGRPQVLIEDLREIGMGVGADIRFYLLRRHGLVVEVFLQPVQQAAESRVATKTIADFERGQRVPYDRTLADIQRALEAAGVEFTNGGQPGVRMKATKKSRIGEEGITG